MSCPEITLPLCNECGEKAEVMLSVKNLIGEVFMLHEIIPELCYLCRSVLEHTLYGEN